MNFSQGKFVQKHKFAGFVRLEDNNEFRRI